jgi:hypothetical protein
LSLFWSDVQYWKWWPRIGLAAMAGVLVLFALSAFNDPLNANGKGPAGKCWNWGGRSDDTWNC